MNQLHRVSSVLLMLASAVLMLTISWWLFTNKPNSKTPEKPAPAATVSKITKEDALNTVTLTETAAQRIELKLGQVEQRQINRVRSYGGEAMIPVGRTILVAAPLNGVIKPTINGIPKPGQPVKAGQPIFQLLPLLTPDGRASMSASLAEAEGQVNNARTQVELSTIALDRAKRVLKDGAGSQRQVDEALAANEVAKKTLDATLSRQLILKKVIGDADMGTAAPLEITAPEDGILRAVSVLPGQNVPSGAALFEVIDLSTMWLRVPVPTGDLESLNREETAQMTRLGAKQSRPIAEAKPILAPPSANPLVGTVDLFYEMPNSAKTLIPGERVAVSIPVKNMTTSLFVPWSAIAIDIHGGTWIYTPVDKLTFTRRRVVVDFTLGEHAILKAGPLMGTEIVVTGVFELFGAETGHIK